MSATLPAPWLPTAALVRASLGSAVLVILAVLTGRPDLLVLGTPLLLHAALGVRGRPRAVPRVSSSLADAALREGDGTRLRVHVAGAAPVEQVVVAATPHRWVATRPPGAVCLTRSPGDDAALVELPLGLLRWGRREVGEAAVSGTSSWGGFAWGPVPLPGHPLTCLPVPGSFDSRTASPHPLGLVGAHPAPRGGDGFELDRIRLFRPGDRLRRVHWPVSLRTGSLHVTTAVAEEDASVLLVVDGGVEVGESGGVHGAASSLDLAVRAAGAVAEHYLTLGDRVGLRGLGSTGVCELPVSPGRAHLHRVLDTLARVVPGQDREPGAGRLRLQPGTLVLVFSPMLSPEAVAVTSTLAARGVDVVVVDCLPVQPPGAGDGRALVAWRIRLLEREGVLARLRRAGVPIVAWRGPGTLDEVLRRLRRRRSSAGTGAPR